MDFSPLYERRLIRPEKRIERPSNVITLVIDGNNEVEFGHAVISR